MSGWIKLHRALSEHWIFSFKEPDKALAWIDLLIMARHTEGTTMLKGRVQEVKRGQVAMSQLSLQKRWKWSQNKVKRFLELLKKHQMADYQTNDLTTLITICNYDEYQIDERAGERTDGRPDGRPVERTTDDQTDDDIRMKEGKNGKKTDSTPYQAIVGAYHETLPMLPGVQKLTDTRKRHIKARWAEASKQGKDVEYFEKFFRYVSQSDFLTTNSFCNLEWLMKEANFVKVIEGNYHQ